jgi:hypothetical protein
MTSSWCVELPAEGVEEFRLAASIVAMCGVLAIGGRWLVERQTASGDPGGAITGQIAPAASSIPGYGTSELPRVTEPSTTHPYLILSEPHHDSCGRLAGRQGWTEVTVQAEFDSNQAPPQLGKEMGKQPAALGWKRETIPPTPQKQMLWTKTLRSEARATISVQQALGSSTAWEFVAQAPRPQPPHMAVSCRSPLRRS